MRSTFYISCWPAQKTNSSSKRTVWTICFALASTTLSDLESGLNSALKSLLPVFGIPLGSSASEPSAHILSALNDNKIKIREKSNVSKVSMFYRPLICSHICEESAVGAEDKASDIIIEPTSSPIDDNGRSPFLSKNGFLAYAICHSFAVRAEKGGLPLDHLVSFFFVPIYDDKFFVTLVSHICESVTVRTEGKTELLDPVVLLLFLAIQNDEVALLVGKQRCDVFAIRTRERSFRFDVVLQHSSGTPNAALSCRAGRTHRLQVYAITPTPPKGGSAVNSSAMFCVALPQSFASQSVPM